jgi:hypothetical protein
MDGSPWLTVVVFVGAGPVLWIQAGEAADQRDICPPAARSIASTVVA